MNKTQIQNRFENWVYRTSWIRNKLVSVLEWFFVPLPVPVGKPHCLPRVASVKNAFVTLATTASVPKDGTSDAALYLNLLQTSKPYCLWWVCAFLHYLLPHLFRYSTPSSRGKETEILNLCSRIERSRSEPAMQEPAWPLEPGVPNRIEISGENSIYVTVLREGVTGVSDKQLRTGG